eukprot:TRINITY_DN3857_c0_g1_i1.p1 TRINITY_DN3857_c0_g1~~TRINITY_DN3857_c0_g1_i1.p1  ORF type:complete len:725 (-),score=176.98 TRINITY_DN3857_c0_g1_i1:92-2194(-)
MADNKSGDEKGEAAATTTKKKVTKKKAAAKSSIFRPPPTKEELEKHKRAVRRKKLERARQAKLDGERKAERERQAKERDGMRAAEEDSRRYEEECILEKAEEGRRHQEAEEIRKLEAPTISKYEQWKRKKLAEKEWNQYTNCTRRVNPAQECDVNTFVNVWAEQASSLASDVAYAQEAEDIIEDAEMLLYDTVSLCTSAERLHETIHTLRTFSLAKVDDATANFVQHADLYTEGKDNAKVAGVSSSYGVGIWVNFSKSASAVGNLGLIDFTHSGLPVIAEVPSNLAMTNTAIRFMTTDFDALTLDTSEQLPIGNIMYYELLGLPPMPKKVKTWTLRQITAQCKQVVRLNYTPMNKSMDKVQTALMLKAQVQVPPNVLVRGEPPTLAWYSKDSWQSDGLEEVHYDAASRTLTFHTLHSAPHAIIQSRYNEFPFLWWSLKPTGYNTAVFTLSTKSFLDISIEIHDEYYQLLGPDLPELASLRSQRLPLMLLLKRLARSGVNLLLTSSGNAVNAATSHLPQQLASLKKEDAMEQRVYHQLSRLAAGFSFTRSKWNFFAGPRKAILLVSASTWGQEVQEVSGDEAGEPSAEAEADDELLPAASGDEFSDVEPPPKSAEPEQKTLLCSDKNSVLVTNSESKPEYAGTLLPNVKFHEDMHHCMLDAYPSASADAQQVWQRAQQGSTQFARAVEHLFSLLRPLSTTK